MSCVPQSSAKLPCNQFPHEGLGLGVRCRVDVLSCGCRTNVCSSPSMWHRFQIKLRKSLPGPLSHPLSHAPHGYPQEPAPCIPGLPHQRHLAQMPWLCPAQEAKPLLRALGPCVLKHPKPPIHFLCPRLAVQGTLPLELLTNYWFACALP